MQLGLPESFRIADFLDWHREKRLQLNPDFQRRSVWTHDGRSFLINSVLRGFPMPKVYLRTTIDTLSQKAVREVVDGQQRIRAVIDFANGTLRLNKRAAEYAGMRYLDLDDDAKQAFLSYSISVEQLMNANDNVVLEIFSRLNTYSVPLNAAELRNAKYNGDFKFTINQLAKRLSWLWEKYSILSIRDRLRMQDDEFTAELAGVLLDGVKNGGKPYLDRLYGSHDATFEQSEKISSRIENTLMYVDTYFADAVGAELFSRPPHLLILFAAVAHRLHGIPKGDLGSEWPDRNATGSIDPERANDNLLLLTSAVTDDNPTEQFTDFALASKGATVRKQSRITRFRYVWQAITGTGWAA